MFRWTSWGVHRECRASKLLNSALTRAVTRVLGFSWGGLVRVQKDLLVFH